MENKMKKSLLFGILILTISLFTNCQKENINELEIKTSKTLPELKAIVIDGGKLLKNNKKLNKHLNTFINKKNNTHARTVTSSEYGFSIDTTRVQQIETTSYKSYTFIVERESYDETILENYVYTIYNDSTATQYLINYPLNSYSEFDIANATIQSINDSSLIYNRGSDCQGFADVVEYQDPVCVDNNCNEGGDHSPGEACDDGVYRATRTCTQGGWVDVGCTSGGGGTASNGNGDYNPDNQTTGGNGNTNSGETPEVTETVVVPLPIDYQQQIENCINGLTIIGQTDNTTIDSNLLDQLNNRQKAEINNYLQQNGCNELAQEEIIEYLEVLVEIPTARLDRLLQLKEILNDNPWALIQDCAEQNGLDTSNYLDLYDQTIPQECSDRLFNMGVEWHHQDITDGNVPLANIDYYGVEVTNYPDFNNNGIDDSEAEIYQAFREKFIDVASGELQNFQFSCDINFDGVVDSDDTGDTDWEFVPLTTQDGTDFVSNNPIASILLIEATASGLGSLAADDGAVIVSGFTANDWTISTIMTANNGTQPFSGNRQWGWFINQNGNFEFFTRAVDVANISKLLNFLPGGANTECQQDTYYNIAEATWENMQQEIVDWINSPESNGGQASIVPKTAIRVDREKIEELLTSNETINEINCD